MNPRTRPSEPESGEVREAAPNGVSSSEPVNVAARRRVAPVEDVKREPVSKPAAPVLAAGRDRPARLRPVRVVETPVAKAGDALPAFRVVEPNEAARADGDARGLDGSAAPRVSRTARFALLAIGLPTALVALYMFFIASPQYVAEFKFAVTDQAPGSPLAGVAGNTSAIASLAGLGGASTAMTQNYMVTEYLASRQAVVDLERRIGLRARYENSNIDWLSRFNSSRPLEWFVRYWQRQITTYYDPITGIATAEVKAYSPSDAQVVASTLVTLSEELVNRIAMRTKLDAVAAAEREVARAELRLAFTREQLTRFRNEEGVIEPGSSVVSGNTQQVQAVQMQLIQLETELNSLSNQKIMRDSPVETALRAKVNATRAQLNALQNQVARERGGSTVLTGVVGRYEQLELDRQYAQATVVATRAALDQAKINAGSQTLYLTPFVTPGLPESAAYPYRLLTVLAAAGLFSALWMCGLLVFRSFADRR